FFFQAEDGIRDFHVTGVQTCALPISPFELRGPPNVIKEVEHFRCAAMQYGIESGACKLNLTGAQLEVLEVRHERQPAVTEGANKDRKSTRLNSSHVKISYAVFGLKKK